MHKSTFTGIGAVVSAVLASLCCIGPLVLTGLGVAGLGAAGLAFTLFEPYRPYLIGLTGLFLGLGFYVMYRKPAETCQEVVCAVPRSHRMQKAGLWIVTGLTGLMVAAPYLPLSVASSTPVDTALVTTALRIEGMT